ncbi:MAG: hypothetical protein JXA11_09785 [Phycisphaerae bacterium]|nr:hypothetical protein [Phycisphaerae bacterium]
MDNWSELFDEGLDVRTPVSDEQIAAVPAKRGVVLLAGENNEPIVMLTAADMRARTRNRLAERTDEDLPVPSKRPDLRRITRRVFYRRCGSHFETDLWFLEIAHILWPKRHAKMISWKAPWFIHIHLEDAYPYFQRTREVYARPGSYLGPFADAKGAESFIEGLQESFDLCRSITCLRRAPNGPRCAYAEMGRCVSPADGTISMDAYREILAEALAFAGGDRATLRDKLTSRMKSAAEARDYERAGSFKARLERLSLFERECFREVHPADEFGYILVHRGGSRREARVFLVWRGDIVPAGAIQWPLQENELQGVLDRMKILTARTPPCDDFGRLRMGLITRSLFADPPRGGVAVRWCANLTPETLGEIVQTRRDDLGLSAAVEKKQSADDAKEPE